MADNLDVAERVTAARAEEAEDDLRVIHGGLLRHIADVTLLNYAERLALAAQRLPAEFQENLAGQADDMRHMLGILRSVEANVDGIRNRLRVARQREEEAPA